jgi:AraC-like DNA-binding protein
VTPLRVPLDRLSHGQVARHRHSKAYAAIVLEGTYEEAGDAGRFRVGAGDLLVHRDYEAHCNVISARGATVINLPVARAEALPSAFKVADPAHFLQVDPRDEAALRELLVPVQVITPRRDDWPDFLAAALRNPSVLNLRQWARQHGIVPETVSRGFRRVFGVTAARYRVEARTRAALAAIRSTQTPLAALASDLGFADQAHMSRAVQALTAASPLTWRKVNSVQE